MMMIDNFTILFSVHNQLYATVIANLIIVSYGVFMGWLSPALSTLMSEHTPLRTGPLSLSDLSWVAGSVSLGAMVGTFLFGILSVKYGSKFAMTFCAIPCIASWIVIYFGDIFYYVLLARFIGGFTSGAFESGVLTFVSEIAYDNIRNRIGSILPLAKHIGITLAFIGGSCISYESRAIVFAIIPLIYIAWVQSLPNTPQLYLQKDKFLKAEKSIKYYRECQGKSDLEKAIFKAVYQRLKTNEQERRKNTTIELKDFQNLVTIKGFATSFAMAWLMQATGIVIITNFASLIFQQCGTSLGVNASSTVLAVMQTVGGVVSTQLYDFRRKTKLYFSLSCSAFGLFTFAVYSYLRHSDYDVSRFLWLPVTSLSFVIFTSSVGIVTICNTCGLENFSPKIRPIGIMFHSMCLNVIAFLGDKLFPISLDVIHLHGFMLFLGLNCCVGLIFVTFMDETSTPIDLRDPPECRTPVPKSSPLPPPSMKQHLRNKLSVHF